MLSVFSIEASIVASLIEIVSLLTSYALFFSILDVKEVLEALNFFGISKLAFPSSLVTTDPIFIPNVSSAFSAL